MIIINSPEIIPVKYWTPETSQERKCYKETQLFSLIFWNYNKNYYLYHRITRFPYSFHGDELLLEVMNKTIINTPNTFLNI